MDTLFVFAAIALVLVALLSIGVAYRISTLVLYAGRRPIPRTPTDYGLPYAGITFLSKDGLALKGWWIPADARPMPHEDKPAVVLLHPYLGNRHGLDLHQVWPLSVATTIDLLSVAQAFHRVGYNILMFDFRSHGESPSALCAGGFTEDQDVMGAVDYAFQRLAPEHPKKPKVGIVGFGLGAAAALVAAGREKGGAEVIRVFSGDSEGGAGFLTIQPLTVKRARFLVAVEPNSLLVALPLYLRRSMGPWGIFLLPLIDRFCQWRGGFPRVATRLDNSAREAHIPLLYVDADTTMQTASTEIQRLYECTAPPKQVCRLHSLTEHSCAGEQMPELIDTLLSFAGQYINAASS